jgi:hypothetical protein
LRFALHWLQAMPFISTKDGEKALIPNLRLLLVKEKVLPLP